MKRYLLFVGRTITDQKRALGIILGLFLIGVTIGIVGSASITSYVETAVKNLINQFKSLHGFSLFVQIFLHNFLAAVTATVSGILFGIFPVISVFLNGMILGSIFAHLTKFTNWTLYQAVLSIIPHGMFEIPAFLLASALGATLGTWPLKKDKRKFLVSAFNTYSIIFFKIIIPLLIIAAAIETTGIELLR
jgi:stage II sporulation protein M